MSAQRSPIHRSGIAILSALLLLAALPVTTAMAATNDERASAIVVGMLPFADTQDTSDATTALDDPECAGNGPTVWYEFTAASTMDVHAMTFDSDYDTTLSVYVDDGLGGLAQVVCVDDHLTTEAAVDWTAEAGTTYWIMVGSFGSQPGGPMNFAMDAGLLPPPPDPIGVTIDILGATLHRSTNQVTVDVSITCSEPAVGFVSVGVRQRAGRVFIEGFGGAELACDVDPTVTSVTTQFESGIFAGGRVLVSAFAEVYSETSWGVGFAEESVRMRGVR